MEEVEEEGPGLAARVAIYAIKTAVPRNSAAIRGLCVIQSIDPRSFLNALFRSHRRPFKSPGEPGRRKRDDSLAA